MSAQTATAPATVRLDSVKINIEVDESPDLSYLDQFEDAEKGTEEHKYYKQDQKRKASFGDTWHMVGVYATASIEVNGVIQSLRSGGLWGIESDSNSSHFVETAREEVDTLRDIVAAFNIDLAAFDELATTAIEKIELP